jgi:hypothetical protein
MTRAWTTPADVRAKARRRWTDGSLLQGLARGEPFPELDVPLRGPRSGEIGDDLGAVQQWILEIEAGSGDGRRYDVVYASVGGRHVGRNSLPARARVTSYDQAWRLLGVTAEVSSYLDVVGRSAQAQAVREWAVAHPLRAVELAGEWEAIVAAYRWLDAARGSGRYLREITAPGVDTKLVERHRLVLAQMLGVERELVSGLGLQAKPESVRLRFDEGFLGMPPSLSEATFRVAELASVRVTVAAALVVENETTYLTVPVPEQGVVLWGKGFEVGRLGALPWLRTTAVHYWGDLDTHGFAILHQLRASLPQTRSFLMDRETLLQHRDRWGREPSPTAARLDRLTDAEASLYADLVSDRLGDRVRLEQERVDWSWAVERLPET